MCVCSCVALIVPFVYAQLAAAVAAGLIPIIVSHHPPFLKSEHEAHQYYNMPLIPRAKLLSMARRHGVGHILCGHTHTTRSVTTADGIVIYTTAVRI